RRPGPRQLRPRPEAAGRDPRGRRPALAFAAGRGRLAQLRADGDAARAGRRPAATRLLAGPAVGDRRAAVAPERLRPQLDTRRRLAALVLRAVDHPERPLDDVRVEAVLAQLLAGAVELDVRLEHAVELRIRREGVLGQLVGAQPGARRPGGERLRAGLA